MAELPGPPLLPQELIDHIIDQLHNNTTSLKACAVVSRAWLPSSRLHLLSQTQVNESHFHEFFKFTRDCEHGPQYIRRLTLNGQLSQHTGAPNHVPVTPAVLSSILSHLPHIEHLFLFMVLLREEESNPRSKPILIPPLPRSIPPMYNLKSLTLYYCGSHDDRLIHVAEILGVFQTIGELTIRSLRFAMGLGEPDMELQLVRTAVPSLPALGTVKITDRPLRTNLYLCLLVLPRMSSNLDTLEISSGHDWDHAPLGSLLLHVGPQLKRLLMEMCGFVEPRNIDEFCDALHLSACTALESFVISISPQSFLRRPLSLPSLCRIIATLPRATLRTIGIHINLQAVFGDLAHPWNPLDETLSRFEMLERVVFVEPHVAESSSYWDLVRGAFPRTARKAKIEIGYL